MDFTNYILENKLILIPVLFVIGSIIKNLSYVNDKYIPLIILVLSICFNIGDTGFNIESIIQGVLIAGTTVFTHQIFKQVKEEK